KVTGIQQMLARRRARLRYLPSYSPDLAPIELCWSKLKTHLRTAKARGATPLTRRLPKPWLPSRPRMRAAGSLTVAMPYSSLKTAVVWCPINKFVRYDGISFRPSLAVVILARGCRAKNPGLCGFVLAAESEIPRARQTRARE